MEINFFHSNICPRVLGRPWVYISAGCQAADGPRRAPTTYKNIYYNIVFLFYYSFQNKHVKMVISRNLKNWASARRPKTVFSPLRSKIRQWWVILQYFSFS